MAVISWLQLMCGLSFLLSCGAHLHVELDNAEDIVRKTYAAVDMSGQSNLSKLSDPTGCACVDYNCGCCQHLDIKQLHINDTGCVNVSYLPHEYGINLSFTIDGYALINMTVSARNPPPICIALPHLEKEASLCIDFYDLDFSNKTFSGCLKLEARLVHVIVEKVKLGCFHFPLGKMSPAQVVALKQLAKAHYGSHSASTFVGYAEKRQAICGSQRLLCLSQKLCNKCEGVLITRGRLGKVGAHGHTGLYPRQSDKKAS